MTLEQIAQLFGMPPDALARSVNAHISASPDTSAVEKDFVHQFTAALEQATVLFEDRSVAIRWLREERIECFGGRTGLDLLLAGRGKNLIPYIESLQAGYLG